MAIEDIVALVITSSIGAVVVVISAVSFTHARRASSV